MESNILMKPVTLAGINEMALPNYTTSNVAYELWLKCTYLYLLVFPPCWTIRRTARHSHPMAIMSRRSVSSSPWTGLTDLTTAQWSCGLELLCSDLSVLGWGGTVHNTQGFSPEYVERLKLGLFHVLININRNTLISCVGLQVPAGQSPWGLHPPSHSDPDPTS